MISARIARHDRRYASSEARIIARYVLLSLSLPLPLLTIPFASPNRSFFPFVSFFPESPPLFDRSPHLPCDRPTAPTAADLRRPESRSISIEREGKEKEETVFFVNDVLPRSQKRRSASHRGRCESRRIPNDRHFLLPRIRNRVKRGERTSSRVLIRGEHSAGRDQPLPENTSSLPILPSIVFGDRAPPRTCRSTTSS